MGIGTSLPPTMVPKVTMAPHRDRLTHNDVIGTAFLGMSKISAPGGELEGKGGKQAGIWDAWPWRSCMAWLEVGGSSRGVTTVTIPAWGHGMGSCGHSELSPISGWIQPLCI